MNREQCGPPPRVCLALRWREARSSPAEARQAPASDGSHPHRGPSSSSRAPESPSRLCLLRRRRSARAPRYDDGSSGGDAAVDGEACSILGVGLSCREDAAAPQLVVQTPFIAVEGWGAQAAALSSSDSPRRPVQAAGAVVVDYTDAHLTDRLADVIATELVHDGSTRPSLEGGGRSLPRRAPAAAVATSREVLTFTMGPPEAANSAFLFGGAAGQRSSLFSAVLDRLFSNPCANAAARGVAVAVSVIEVRDAAPLRHPSVLQRPRVTVDLLSGAVLHTELGEADSTEASGDDCADLPSDIPAACYVRVRSADAAVAVLRAALASSVGWSPSPPQVWGRPCTTGPSPALLHPACGLTEERPSHVCVTLLVSPEEAPASRTSVPERRGADHDASRGARHGDAERSADAAARVRRGAVGLTTTAAAAPPGIWRMWDVAAPSVPCGYRPLVEPLHTAAAAATSSGAPPPPALPWSSRYSLAALTHTCLAEVGRSLASSARDTSGTVDSLLQHDTSAALRIASAALTSSSLVVPLFAVVPDSAADEMNTEVVRAAAGWAALGRAYQHDVVQPRHRVRGSENADAARRVLREYAVPWEECVEAPDARRPQTPRRDSRHVAAAASAARRSTAAPVEASGDVVAPLSIDVTASAEDAADLRRPPPHTSAVEASAVPVVGGVGEVRPPAAAPPPHSRTHLAAACAAAAAVDAEEARLRRFRTVFEAESFDMREAVEAGADSPTAPAPAAHTPLAARGGSPPPVPRTALREPPLPILPSSVGDASHLQDSPGTADTTATSLCPPQALVYECTSAVHEGSPTGTAAAPADAALAAFLKPYCDEFVCLYGDMRAGVQAWRAQDAATLAGLSSLMERHTRDMETMMALQRQQHLLATSSPSSAGASDGDDVGATVRAAFSAAATAAGVGGGGRSGPDGVAASTSALIFDQLVRAEDKVVWLERQLVEWRRRAQEASVLDTSALDADATLLLREEEEGAIKPGPSEDPTTLHVRNAAAILQRLLRRCTRAYATVQRRGDRWPAQLAQEQAAKAALQARVVELEAEVAALRARSGVPGSATPSLPHRHLGSAGAVQGGGGGDGEVGAWGSGGLHTPPRRAASLDVASVDRGLDRPTAGDSALTPAQVSRIVTDAASSLASSAAGQHRRTHLIDSTATRSTMRTPGPAAARERSVDGEAWIAPELATLLTRAVRGGGDVDAVPASSQRVAAAPAPLLFDVHIGVSSAASSRDGDAAPLWRADTPSVATARSPSRESGGTGGGDGVGHRGPLEPLAPAASPQRLQRRVMAPHSRCDGVDATYPSAALEALETAATRLTAEAVRWSGATHDHRRAGQHGGGEAMKRCEGGPPAESIAPAASVSLHQSMGQLRSAAQAVQREAHDAAERERAYLSALVFSPSTSAGAV
ncbi:hypothetical protein NESM_000430400 [Novymonas esmeraldas]|uniref:Kinesin motor domain-containing protein n=1 Tax=Novymonas esmeraldas TaxID=1808958 RepID=A0AAW0EMW5_9TRYP